MKKLRAWRSASTTLSIKAEPCAPPRALFRTRQGACAFAGVNLRKVADHLIEGHGTSNSNEDFATWQRGFEYARSVPDGATVYYAIFAGARITAIYHSPKTLHRVLEVIQKYQSQVVELEKLVEVGKVMDS